MWSSSWWRERKTVILWWGVQGRGEEFGDGGEGRGGTRRRSVGGVVVVEVEEVIEEMNEVVMVQVEEMNEEVGSRNVVLQEEEEGEDD